MIAANWIMIIVKLIGGLGNQLFQYAAGRRLAYVRKAQLKLDVSGFETYKLHKYGLNHFNIVEEFASAADISRCRSRKSLPVRAAGAVMDLFGSSRAISLVKEKHFNFDREIIRERDNTYLDGYWQSEKYFRDIERIIHREFAFKSEPDEANRDAARLIIGCDSVSVHIRRGDYVSDPITNSAHGTVSPEYYRAAMKMAAARRPGARFFVFTDDPEWVREHMPFEYPVTLMTHNDVEHNYEDLRLMSLCKHNILANSTFSWWGAWLNLNPEKIVIYPAKWFNDVSLDTRDLAPEGWLRV
jgi:hypothetical protein